MPVYEVWFSHDAVFCQEWRCSVLIFSITCLLVSGSVHVMSLLVIILRPFRYRIWSVPLIYNVVQVVHRMHLLGNLQNVIDTTICLRRRSHQKWRQVEKHIFKTGQLFQDYLILFVIIITSHKTLLCYLSCHANFISM